MKENTDVVKIRVSRYNPGKDKEPYFQEYSLRLEKGQMNMLQALNMIYEQQDSTLAFRQYCCGHQLCNSCLMVINGKPAYACKTLVDGGMEFTVAPLWKRPVIRDLVVDV